MIKNKCPHCKILATRLPVKLPLTRLAEIENVITSTLEVYESRPHVPPHNRLIGSTNTVTSKLILLRVTGKLILLPVN